LWLLGRKAARRLALRKDGNDATIIDHDSVIFENHASGVDRNYPARLDEQIDNFHGHDRLRNQVCTS
jgi:hypothetical protein